MRLKAIAVERAPTIAMVIQKICLMVGRPFAASTAPSNANGSANSVCSILIISSVTRTFLSNAVIGEFNLLWSLLPRIVVACLSTACPANGEPRDDRECGRRDDRPALQLFAGDDKSRDWRE